jgi:hypothetical protein
MSPIGKKKCSYKPMQKKGLISPGEENKEKNDFVTISTANKVDSNTSLKELTEIQEKQAKFFEDEKNNINHENLRN